MVSRSLAKWGKSTENGATLAFLPEISLKLDQIVWKFLKIWTQNCGNVANLLPLPRNFDETLGELWEFRVHFDEVFDQLGYFGREKEHSYTRKLATYTTRTSRCKTSSKSSGIELILRVRAVHRGESPLT